MQGSVDASHRHPRPHRIATDEHNDHDHDTDLEVVEIVDSDSNNDGGEDEDDVGSGVGQSPNNRSRIIERRIHGSTLTSSISSNATPSSRHCSVSGSVSGIGMRSHTAASPSTIVHAAPHGFPSTPSVASQHVTLNGVEIAVHSSRSRSVIAMGNGGRAGATPSGRQRSGTVVNVSASPHRYTGGRNTPTALAAGDGEGGDIDMEMHVSGRCYSRSSMNGTPTQSHQVVRLGAPSNHVPSHRSSRADPSTVQHPFGTLERSNENDVDSSPSPSTISPSPSPPPPNQPTHHEQVDTRCTSPTGHVTPPPGPSIFSTSNLLLHTADAGTRLSSFHPGGTAPVISSAPASGRGSSRRETGSMSASGSMNNNPAQTHHNQQQHPIFSLMSRTHNASPTPRTNSRLANRTPTLLHVRKTSWNVTSTTSTITSTASTISADSPDPRLSPACLLNVNSSRSIGIASATATSTSTSAPSSSRALKAPLSSTTSTRNSGDATGRGTPTRIHVVRVRETETPPPTLALTNGRMPLTRAMSTRDLHAGVQWSDDEEEEEAEENEDNKEGDDGNDDKENEPTGKKKKKRHHALGDTSWHRRLYLPPMLPGGEIDPEWLARKARKRARFILRTFWVYTAIFLLLELPYVLYAWNHADPPPDLSPSTQHAYVSNWRVMEGGLWPLLIRIIWSMCMVAIGVWIHRKQKEDRKRYKAYIEQANRPPSSAAAAAAGNDEGTVVEGLPPGIPARGMNYLRRLTSLSSTALHPSLPTEPFIGLVVFVSGLMILLMEALRDRAFISSNFLVADGVLLNLTLVYCYMLCVLRMSRMQSIVQGSLLLLAFNGGWAAAHGEEEIKQDGGNYLAKGSAYLILLLASSILYHLQLASFREHQDGGFKRSLIERRKADKLLRSMLPGSVYATVLDGRTPNLSGIASIGFCNVELKYDKQSPPSPAELMQRLHDTFKRIDSVVSVYKVRGVHKIETVSKTYLLCSGLLEEVEDHAAAIVDVCLEIMHMIRQRNQLLLGIQSKKKCGRITAGLKIGIATGPVVGGMIGTTRRFVRIFGDIVNVAARMCTNCDQDWQIQANKYTYDSLNELQRAQYKIPGCRALQIKGKGSMQCYLIDYRDDWAPRFGKAILNRGRDFDDDADETRDLSSSATFAFHKLVRHTQLESFPTLVYHSSYSHPEPDLLQSEGPSKSTSNHVEYRFQIYHFNAWKVYTKKIIFTFFIWCVACFGTVTYQELTKALDSGQGVGALGVDFFVLCASMILMLAVHFVSTYMLASTNLYKKHTQRWNALYAALLAAWILAALWFWKLNDGPIAPHFAFILLNLYTGLYLHLQIRFFLPITATTLIIFLILLIAKSYNFFDIFFVFIPLLLCTSWLIVVVWHAEDRLRSAYLLQYALDMEQRQVDKFLKNLLPSFVVSVLKKRKQQRGTTLKDGADEVELDDTGKPVYAAQAKKQTSATSSEQDKARTPTSGTAGSSSSVPASAAHVGVAAGAGAGSRLGALKLAGLANGLGPRRSVGQMMMLARAIGKFRRIGAMPPLLNGTKSVFQMSESDRGGLASRFAMFFPMATVFESDIVGYTKLVSNWPAQRTLAMLNELFSLFDALAKSNKVEKIETIGDAYMTVTFEDDPDAVLSFALDAIAALREMNQRRFASLEADQPQKPIEIRAGVCMGPCYGGVLGSDVPRFHMFGPAHDGSIQLEQNGTPMGVMVNDAVVVASEERFRFEARPDIVCEDVYGVHQLLGRTEEQDSQASSDAGRSEAQKEKENDSDRPKSLRRFGSSVPRITPTINIERVSGGSRKNVFGGVNIAASSTSPVVMEFPTPLPGTPNPITPVIQLTTPSSSQDTMYKDLPRGTNGTGRGWV